MKRLLTALLVIVILTSIIISSCGGDETTTSPTTTTTSSPTSTATAPPSTTSTTTATATSATPTTTEPVYGGTLRIITPLDPTVLGYPPQSAGRATFYQYCVLERLAIYAPDVWESQDYQGVLATDWEDSNDMKTWTFNLREGVKFHDGTDWNAEVVKWNAELWVEAGTSTTFNDLASCDVIDEYTVQYNFNSPKSTFMVDVATGIYFISPTSYEANGGKDWALTHPVGTGPFKLVEAVVGSHVYYERFDDYWGGMPYLEAVEYSIVPDATVSAAMMEAGDADMYVYAELKQALDLDAMDDFYTRYCKHHTPEGVWFEARDEASVFYDKRVRQAFEYAVDREAIVAALSLGCPDVEIMYQAPISTDPAYREGWGRFYDVDQALELMDEAGLSAGFETTIYCSSATPRWHDLALMLQGYLEAINVTLNIEIISPGQYMTYLLFGWPTGTLFVSGIPNEPIPEYVAIRDYKCSAAGIPKWNYSTVTTPEMCALMAVLEAATSKEAAIEAYVELSNQAMDDAVGIYMMDWPDTAVFANYVHSDWISYSTKVWNANLTWMEEH